MVNRQVRQRGASTQPRGGFRYKYRSENTVRERAERRGPGRFDSPIKSGTDLWRPKAGNNLIRILPAEDQEHYGLELFVHEWVGVDNGTYLCLSKMKGQSCPMCAAAKIAKDNGDKEDAYQLNWRAKLLCWIIDRDGDHPTIPQLYMMPYTMDRDIAGLSLRRRGNASTLLFIDHPDEGYDIEIQRTGMDLSTRYLPKLNEQCRIHDDERVQEEILDFIRSHPLDEMLHYESADHLARMLSGETQQTDQDLDDDSQDYGHEGQEARDDRRHSEDRHEFRSSREPPSRGRRQPEPEEEEPDDARELWADTPEPERPRRDQDRERDRVEERPRLAERRRRDSERTGGSGNGGNETAEDDDADDLTPPSREDRRPPPRRESPREERRVGGDDERRTPAREPGPGRREVRR